MHIYLCPAALDLILFLVGLAVTYAMGQRDMSDWQAAWLVGGQQVAYMVFSLVSGFILSRRNARPILLASTVASALAGVICFTAATFWPLLVGMVSLGAAAAFFFNSFQSFMRGEAPPGGLGRATALYTLAWSSGSGAGFLAGGMLYELGPVALSALTIFVAAAILVLLHRHESRPHDEPSADEHTEEAPDGAVAAHTTYVWIAWLLIFAAVFVQRPLHTFFSKTGAEEHVPAWLVSVPLCLHMLLQAALGYRMNALRRWMYRPGPLLWVQGAGAALLLVMWLTPWFAARAVGISSLGLWSGFAYYCAVFYASNAGRRARNIGVNEFLVGLGSLVGLFLCAWFMRIAGDPSVLYAVCGAALACSALAQAALILSRRRLERVSRCDGRGREDRE